ncbi:MAG: tyrosine-type recombinase/integrase, partial [Candidatus Limivicinus sp.]
MFRFVRVFRVHCTAAYPRRNYWKQMPNITPHVCRHTYCSIQARAGMYPKTLQYLMGHSDISVTMN